MAIVPYVCGRLMRVSDIALLLRITLIVGVAMLTLLLLDGFTSPRREVGVGHFLARIMARCWWVR